MPVLPDGMPPRPPVRRGQHLSGALAPDVARVSRLCADQRSGALSGREEVTPMEWFLVIAVVLVLAALYQVNAELGR